MLTLGFHRTAEDKPRRDIQPHRIAPAFPDAIVACFHDARLAPRIGRDAIQMQTFVGLVSTGIGIALVPQSVSNLKRPRIEIKPLTGMTASVATGVAWQRDNTSPVLRAFLKLLRKKR
jgi:DNA-binding transcriptional LysR family regulator